MMLPAKLSRIMADLSAMYLPYTKWNSTWKWKYPIIISLLHVLKARQLHHGRVVEGTAALGGGADRRCLIIAKTDSQFYHRARGCGINVVMDVQVVQDGPRCLITVLLSVVC